MVVYRKKKRYVRKNQTRRKRFKKGYQVMRRPRRRNNIITRLPCSSKTFLTRFKYVDKVVLSATLGVPTPHKFRANSCQDPDATGTISSHQPYLWDSVATYFQTARVLGSKITVTYMQAGASVVNEIPGTLFLTRVSDIGTYAIPGSLSLMYEQKHSGKRIPLGIMSSTDVIHPAVRNRIATLGYSPRKEYGNRYSIDQQEFSATTSGSATVPADQTQFWMAYYPNDEASTGSVTVLVSVEYLVHFREPNNIPGQS